MQTVKVKKRFYDKSDNLKLRKAKEVFDTTEERAKQLAELGFVEILPKPKTEKAN